MNKKEKEFLKELKHSSRILNALVLDIEINGMVDKDDLDIVKKIGSRLVFQATVYRYE